MKYNYLTPAQDRWLKQHPELTATSSMLRRSPWHDYCEPCIYMITLVIEGRKPILGTLSDCDESHSKPWVKLSPLGEAVKEAWHELGKFHPQVRSLSLCIMPDHIHGILYVTERLPRHLGHVINGFKQGCRERIKNRQGGVEYSEARLGQHNTLPYNGSEGITTASLPVKDSLQHCINTLTIIPVDCGSSDIIVNTSQY